MKKAEVDKRKRKNIKWVKQNMAMEVDKIKRL